MTNISFIGVTLPAHRGMARELEERFEAFLTQLRARRNSEGVFSDVDKINSGSGDAKLDGRKPDPWKYRLSVVTRSTVQRRAGAIVERINAQSGAQHLTEEQIKRLAPLSMGIPLVTLRNAHAADEIAAALHADFPWMGAATEVVWHALRRASAQDGAGAQIPPLLLNGPPGIGKSTWARRLGDLLGVPTGIIEATSEPAGFAVTGSQKGWNTAASGKPLDLILRTKVANPVFIVDEIEKAGSVSSVAGRSFDLTSALLPLLEPTSSRAWQCPYFQVPFDMSHISWVLTSNDASLIPAPLRSRVQIIDLPDLTSAQLLAFVARAGRRRGLSEVSLEVAQTALAHITHCDTAPSLRTALRVLERAQELETRPRLH